MNQNYLTVSALNRYLKAKLENDIHLNRIYITGELSNVKYHYSGHCYFTLKDDNSRISAVMFQTQLKKVLFKLEDGMKVLAVCRLSVYEPQGTYQLYVEKIDIDGLGNLYMTYEKRRLLLEKEGLFSQSHKKPIPRYPQNIAIITASSGAAIHDIIRTIQKQCPSAKMTLYPSLVQGDKASEMLCRRLKEADKNNHDVIIIGRGGGSLEDLWAFNDELLARTIYQASTPIISGVGHESDVTICDFVADLRAATPTAAAHAACFNQQELELTLDNYQRQMQQTLNRRLDNKKKMLAQTSELPVFKYPERIYQQAIQKNDDLMTSLMEAMHKKMVQKNHQQDLLEQSLLSKANLLINSQKQKLTYDKQQLFIHMKQHLKQQEQYTLSLVQSLNAYNPLSVLERGYTLALQEDKVVTKKEKLDKSKPFTLRFHDGEVIAIVKEELVHEENDL